MVANPEKNGREQREEPEVPPRDVDELLRDTLTEAYHPSKREREESES